MVDLLLIETVVLLCFLVAILMNQILLSCLHLIISWFNIMLWIWKREIFIMVFKEAQKKSQQVILPQQLSRDRGTASEKQSTAGVKIFEIGMTGTNISETVIFSSLI